MTRFPEILQILAATYPTAQTALNHDSPFQLLIATILSAQCTDERINIITRKLFSACPTVLEMDQLSISDLEDYIRSAGLWQTKAKNIKATCHKLIYTFEGSVPKTREELMLLPGVGRKTANVILANAFGIPAIAVDTHVHRVSNRLGLATAKKPEQTEIILMQHIPEQLWAKAHHWLIYHGRKICKARRPLCNNCPLNKLCPSATL